MVNDYFTKTKDEITLTTSGNFALDYFGLSLNDLKQMSSEQLIKHTKSFGDALNDGTKHKSGKDRNPSKLNSKGYFGNLENIYNPNTNHGDSGSFSRYFDLDKWDAQFIITPKAAKSEKNKGLDNFTEKFQSNAEFRPNHMKEALKGSSGKPHGRYTKTKNTHPTVKPISLMKYLITMGSREGDLILDPFMGSGTTAIAAEQTARNWIGIEKIPEYVEIFKARLEDYRKQNKIEAFV